MTEAIAGLAAHLGRAPTLREYEAAGREFGWPGPQNQFGTWRKALEEAGLKPCCHRQTRMGYDSDGAFIAAMTLMVGECLEWQGCLTTHGYGMTPFKGRAWLAHRFVWTALVGLIPAGYHLHHDCENKACVRVSHLECLTAVEHLKRHPATSLESTEPIAAGRTVSS